MGRPWRIEYEGALYHLMSRGNNGQAIFSNENDRILFLETISEMAERYDFEIYAYVLMSNHYHLLVKTLRPNLTKAMQWFGTTYTRRFNNRNFKSGHLFQGRYRSIIVQNDGYLMRLSCYIHRNPVRAGIVERLIDYPWSSYPVYAYGKKSPEWLNTQVILSYFSGADVHGHYRKKVQHYAEEEKRLLEDLHHGFILGAKNFVKQIRDQFLPDKPQAALPHQKQLKKDVQLDEIAPKAAQLVELDLDQAIQANRLRGSAKTKRDLVLFVLWKKGVTNQELGRFFNISGSAVSHSIKAFQNKTKQDSKLTSQFDLLNSQFKL
jgi:REP element-mobilizing transposase RayT/DNA-binding CsgD family transcriptional regulator